MSKSKRIDMDQCEEPLRTVFGIGLLTDGVLLDLKGRVWCEMPDPAKRDGQECLAFRGCLAGRSAA